MHLFFKGLPPLRPRFTFCLDTKSKQKSQGSARFAQKTGVRQAKSPKLAPSYRQELRTVGDFTLASLVFWLTVQGRPNLHEQDKLFQISFSLAER